MHDYRLRVGYADTDQMGFAHHSRYLVWFESARTEMLRSIGASYKSWEERGYMLPLVEASLQFRKPALYDDTVVVRTRLAECTRLRMAFEYEVHAEERGVHLASGLTRHVFMSREGKAVRAGAGILEPLQKWLASL